MSHGKIIALGAAVVVLIFIGIGVANKTLPGTYDAFAQCLADEGTTFYGAYWCPHCQDQKTMFGRSADLLPYFECSLPNREMNDACQEAGIQSYPTWEFANGDRLEGVIELAELAERTGCELSE